MSMRDKIAKIIAQSVLPMDEASRMARAAEQGYTLPAYHTTTADFTAFKRKPNDIGMHFGTAGQAEDRIQYLMDRGVRDMEGARTIPVRLRLNNPLRMEDLGAWGSDNLQYELARDPRFAKDAVLRAMRSGNESGRVAGLRDLIETRGFDSIVYRNTGETAGGAELSRIAGEKLQNFLLATGQKPRRIWSVSPEQQTHPAYLAWKEADDLARAHRETNAQDSYIAFRPNQVRSQFAAFDPANKGGGFLLGSMGGMGALAAQDRYGAQ